MDDPAVVVSITEEPLDGSELAEKLRTQSDGAVVVFEGRVRSSNAGKAVLRMHYDAYPAMATRVLNEIAVEATRQFEIGAIGVAHRVGMLELGEASVVVAATSPHRDPAYAASRYVIEAIKSRLPIWKQEHYADGSRAWLDGEPPRAEVE